LGGVRGKGGVKAHQGRNQFLEETGKESEMDDDAHNNGDNQAKGRKTKDGKRGGEQNVWKGNTLPVEKKKQKGNQKRPREPKGAGGSKARGKVPFGSETHPPK